MAEENTNAIAPAPPESPPKQPETKKDDRRPGPKRYPADFIPFPESCAAWRDQKAACESLRDLFNASVEAAQDRIDWYDRKCAKTAYWAWYVRFFAVVLVGIGGLAPLIGPLANLIFDLLHVKSPLTATQAGYIALALAGLFVGLDNALGWSSSWMRYRVVQSEIVRRLARFRYDWAARLAGQDQAKMTPADYRSLVELQRDFVDTVEAAIERETQVWAKSLKDRTQAFDSRNKLPQYEEDGTPSPADAIAGTIEATISTVAPVDANTLKAALDGGGANPTDGQTPVSFEKVTPGHHVVTVTAKRSGTDVSSQKFVEVGSGKTVQTTITV